tara:strand:- start:1269 stop:3266 length:1998 start_codon:yes stop_codon:yes gene_type:complete
MSKPMAEPIEETQVIELRQQSNSATIYDNADYRVDLDKDIIINENDIVKIKSVFVDSVAQSDDKIHVDPDVLPTDPNFATATELERTHMSIQTNHNLYYRNWGFTYFSPDTQRDYQVGGLPSIDGKDYIATFVKDASTSNIVKVSGIVFGFSNYFGKKKDPVHVNLQYTTPAGNTNYLRLQVPQKDIQHTLKKGNEKFIIDANTKLASGSHKINFPITCVKDSIKISEKNDKHQDSNKKQLHEGGLARPSNTGDVQTADNTNDFFVPMDFPQTFHLKAGDYNKKDLARELTVLFSQFTNKSGEVAGLLGKNTFDAFATGQPYPNDVGGNTFLMSAKSLRLTRGNGQQVGTIGDSNGRPTFVRVDSKNAFQFKKENPTGPAGSFVSDYWIGSDVGIEVDYNEIVDKYEIIQTHMSLRDKNSNAITSGSFVDIDGTEFLQVNNKLTGIYLKNLEPEDFWFNKLGFDRNILVDDSKQITLGSDPEYPTWDDGSAKSVPNLETQLIDGETVTGDLATTTNLTFKGNQAPAFDPDNGKQFADGGIAFDLAVAPTAFNIATQTTMSIYADKDNTPDTADHEEKAYFKVEVDMGLSNDLINAKNPRVKSIMNRYYSVDSYTTSYGEGDITYQHKGEPVKCSSIGIRILKPDGSLSDDIGNANSVFLEIIKQK